MFYCVLTPEKENMTALNVLVQPQAYHPLFVFRTCASCILMVASVVYKGCCEYDN